MTDIEKLAVELERAWLEPLTEWWKHPAYIAYRNARYELLLAERGVLPKFPARMPITLEAANAAERKAHEAMVQAMSLFDQGRIDPRRLADNVARWQIAENTYRRVNDYERERNQHDCRDRGEEFTDTDLVKPTVHPTAVGPRYPWTVREESKQRWNAAYARVRIPRKDRMPRR